MSYSHNIGQNQGSIAILPFWGQGCDYLACFFSCEGVVRNRPTGLGVKLNVRVDSPSPRSFHRSVRLSGSRLPPSFRYPFSWSTSPFSSRYHPTPNDPSGVNNESYPNYRKSPGTLLLVISDRCLTLTLSFPRLPFRAEQLLG